MMQNNRQVYFARSLALNDLVGIEKADRRYHMFAIGRTGVGKSTMLLNLIVQDMRAGRGIAVIDPHGDLALDVLRFVPHNRKDDVLYINPADIEYPVGLNIFERTTAVNRHLVAANIISIFQKSFADSWGPRMGYLLHNTVLALLETKNTTLLGITRMLTNESYRKSIVKNVSDPLVRNYWEKEFTAFHNRQIGEVISPVLNKIGAYLTHIPLRNMLGQPKSKCDFAWIINASKLLIVNLSKGQIGEDAANLLGSIVVSKLQLAAYVRAAMPENRRRDFHCYIDEFQNFTTESFVGILAEARKYRLNLVLANQYLGQLDERIRSSVLANIGTLVVFRVGPEDSRILAKEFGGDFPESNLMNLDPHEVYYKCMRGGKVSQAHIAVTLAPPEPPHKDDDRWLAELVNASRKKLAWSRSKIEEKISKEFS